MGQKRGRLRETKEKGLAFYKRAQANEFKLKFEFKQPKAMQQ
jgi:hypothetical protein